MSGCTGSQAALERARELLDPVVSAWVEDDSRASLSGIRWNDPDRQEYYLDGGVARGVHRFDESGEATGVHAAADSGRHRVVSGRRQGMTHTTAHDASL